MGLPARVLDRQDDRAHPPWLLALLALDAFVYRWARLAWDRAAATPGAWYDAALAERIVTLWPKYFRHTEGRWAGKPFLLAPWQAAIVRLLVGWKTADGFRVFRRLLLWVGRKNGKSEFLAALAILFWVFDREMGGQGYCFARNEKQAKIVFDKMKTMVGLAPALHTRIQRYKKSMYQPEQIARFEMLTGNAEGKHGMSASVVVGDEAHEWLDDSLLVTLHQSTAARDQPVELIGSTAGFKNRTYGWTLWRESEAILEGRLSQPSTLVVIFAVDQDADWTDESLWWRANPNIGISPKLEYLRAECEKAKENPRLENDFRRYHLNQWTEQAVRWIPMSRWDACTASKLPWHKFAAHLKGRTCFAGLDLSSVRDVTALVYVFPPSNDDADPFKSLWYVLPKFFVPAETLDERVRADRVPYDEWKREIDGVAALIPTDGNVVDQDVVKATLLADRDQFDIRMVGYDQWNSTKLATELTNEGATLIKVPQSVVGLGEATKFFEGLVWDAGLDHGGHPVLRWMAGNVSVWSDGNGNIKPDKKRSSEKIDGISGAITAFAPAIKDARVPDVGELMKRGGAAAVIG